MDRDYLKVLKRDDMSDEKDVLRLRVDTMEKGQGGRFGVFAITSYLG
jgi:hypothetical protein